jgi:integrase
MGQLVRRGKREPVWIGRYWQPVLREGRFAKVRRADILGSCASMSRSKAREALATLLRPINEGLRVPVCAETFGELWYKWKGEILINYRESTRGFYERTITRWILPYFERWPLEDITPLACQHFINQFSGYSASVLKHVRASLSRILAGAVDWAWLKSNPAARLRLPAGKPVQRATVLSPAQLSQVMAGLPEPYRSMVVIAAHTGIRECEVMALRWADFDRENKVLSVERSVYRSAVGETKTEAGRRSIPYGSIVEDALRRLEGAQPIRDGYLFVAPKGGFYSPQRITRLVFKPLAHSLGLPRFTWRSFRRSAATAMHLADVPLKVQQEILGHANPDMSLLYTDPDLEAKRKAIQKFEALMDASGPRM